MRTKNMDYHEVLNVFEKIEKNDYRGEKHNMTVEKSHFFERLHYRLEVFWFKRSFHIKTEKSCEGTEETKQ